MPLMPLAPELLVVPTTAGAVPEVKVLVTFSAPLELAVEIVAWPATVRFPPPLCPMTFKFPKLSMVANSLLLLRKWIEAVPPLLT